jgi:hypothetical protein
MLDKKTCTVCLGEFSKHDGTFLEDGIFLDFICFNCLDHYYGGE